MRPTRGGLLVLGLLVSLASTTRADSFAVTNANGSGPGSFPQAITDSNAHTGPNTITFNIPGSSVHTISPASPLPPIMQPVVIDGYTQPGASPNTNPVGQGLNTVLMIELTGSNALLQVDSAGAGTTIRGLNIQGTGAGIVFNPVLTPTTLGNTVEGCFIGTNVTGTAAGLGKGILIESSNNLIGGTSPAARNLISGNDEGDAAIEMDDLALFTLAFEKMQGNLIGTDITGTSAIPNAGDGIKVDQSDIASVLIGGLESGAGNLISGNGIAGIELGGSTPSGSRVGTTIQGNFIGTDVTGSFAIPNGQPGSSIGVGIFIPGLNGGNTIGGTAAGAGNLISGNRDFGIFLGSPGNLVQGNTIGPSRLGIAAIRKIVQQAFGGVSVSGSNNVIGGTTAGAGNLVAFNDGDAIVLSGSSKPTGVGILGNSIHDNAGLGIRLNGGNNNQPAPALTFASITGGIAGLSGTLDAAPSTAYRIELFSNGFGDPSGFGEGQTFLGSTVVTTDGSGHATFGPMTFTVLPAQTVFTATATDPANDTSEFCQWDAVGNRFYIVPLCRLADTRNPPGPFGGPALVAKTERTFDIAGQCGVPTFASAISANATVTNTLGPGNLRFFPAGTARPLVSTSNWIGGQTLANNLTFALGVGGGVTVYATEGTDLIIDINGYFAPY